MYFRKPTLKNLSQGARLEYVRRLRHMDADDVAEYFEFGGDDPHKTFRYYENNDRSPSKERLMDNYLDETIDVTMYDMFQKKLSSRIEKYKIEINELEKRCDSLEPLEVRIENVKKSIRRLLNINYYGVNEKVIEEFVEKIIVHKDYFEWKLNFMNETLKLKINCKNKSDCFIAEYRQ